jgi:hypothetical protein
MSRLGLWGPGTVFDSAAKFVRSLDSRGVGVMEMLAMDLKSRGMFLARALSYEGADFEVSSCFALNFSACGIIKRHSRCC